jgi:uncharacterized protein (TIGR02266 family)
MPAKRPHKKTRPRKSHRRRAPSGPAAPRAATPDEAISAVLDALVGPLLDPSPSPPAESTNLPLRGEEHRAHERVVVSVAVGLGTESHFFAGLSGDVSKGGVFVQTYRDIPVGSDVEVLFDLPDGQLRTHGRVRWHRDNSDSSPPGVGIAFEELRTDDWRLIQRFCERRPPLYYDIESA